MLDVLLESRSARTRRLGGTLTSTLVHLAIIAGGVALTVPRPGQATDAPKERRIIYVPLPDRPEVTAAPRTASPRAAQPATRAPSVPVTFKIADPNVAPMDVATPSVVEANPGDALGPGLSNGGEPGSSIGLGGPATGVMDERHVDRAPRLIGRAEPPTFPPALRASGKNGRVLIQFVVDTLGRAEMSELRIVEADDPLFGEAVRRALPRYRFSPGEAGGRKVRTLVQLPFDFTLVR
jgi:protein TonB